MAYKTAYDLAGPEMQMGKPINFVVLNKTGNNVQYLLEENVVNLIDSIFAARYEKGKSDIEKRRKKILEEPK